MKSDLICVILCQRVYDFKNPILFFLDWFHFPYFIYLLYNVSHPTYFQLLSVWRHVDQEKYYEMNVEVFDLW